MIEWQINIREEHLPLIEALALRIPAAPRAFLRQLCKKGRITVNQTEASADLPVMAGERVTVRTSERFLECLEQSGIYPAQILYENKDCLVIDKPAGLATHNARGQSDNLLDRLRAFLKLRGETFRVAPIHRLDIGTSGTILFGKGRSAISQLGRLMMDGQISKHYQALITGTISTPGELNSAVPAKGRVKDALTRYRPVASQNNFTLLDLNLVTGRQHQIRHQLATAGWPIVGDARYRGSNAGEAGRPFLHCSRLTFPELKSGQPITITSPLPKDLTKLLKQLGFQV